MIQTWPRWTAVARAAPSGLPGMCLTSWIPPPCTYCVSTSMTARLKGVTTHVGDGDGVDDLLGVQIPQAELLGALDAETGLEDADGLDKVRGENVLPLPVDAQAVGRELL